MKHLFTGKQILPKNEEYVRCPIHVLRRYFFLFLLLVITNIGQAATITWNDDSGDDLWSNPANWNEGDSGNNITQTPSTSPGEALCFEPQSDDRVNVGDLGGAMDGLQFFTIEAWVNPNDPDQFTGFPGIFSKRAGGTGFALYIQGAGSSNAGAVTVLWLGGLTAGAGTLTLLPDYTWTHVAMTFDGTQTNNADKIKFYFDGVLQPSNYFGAPITSFPTNSHDAHIGTLEPGSNSWTGCLDEVRIWGRPLCEGEISDQMNCELTGSENELISYWNFNHGDAGVNNAGVTTLVDQTPAGNDGTLNNFDLTGTTSNWNAPGGVTTGSACTPYVDNTPPVALCQDITVDLDNSGNYVLTVGEIDNGSNDDSGCFTRQFNSGQTSYTCDDNGNTFAVELLVTDGAGNTDICMANVTVRDELNSTCNQPPIAVCQNITISADASCQGVAAAEEFDGGSSDPDMDMLTFTISPSGPYPLGITNVTLTVSDGTETDQCTAQVTVIDNTSPLAICQDITVQLDANGNASITAADIDGGSSDNCDIASIEISQTSFDCSDISAAGYANNEALDFDGLDDNVVVPNSPSLEISGAFSLEAWIMPNSPGNFGWDIIMGKLTTGDPDYWLIARDGTRRLFFGFRDPSGTQRFVDGTTNLVNGQWYHVAGTYDGNQLKIYLNGVLEATKTIGNIPVRVSSHKPFKLGWHGASWQWHGKIDEARLWSGARSAQEINDHMNTCLSGSESGLIAYYDMQDGTGSNTLTDLSPNGNHGTLTDMDPNMDWTSGNSDVTCGGGGTVVTLTVTDDSGNENSCEAIVTVEDNVFPTAICQDITVQLDANGNASITASQIDNGSSDACGIAGMDLDITAFTCADLGDNTVTLTVTDVNGNVSNCTATVTVQDTEAPVIACPAAVNVSADPGLCEAPGVNLGMPFTDDNCSVASVTNDAPAVFPVGTTTVTWTAMDDSGNSVICTQDVVVTDNEAPQFGGGSVVAFFNFEESGFSDGDPLPTGTDQILDVSGTGNHGTVAFAGYTYQNGSGDAGAGSQSIQTPSGLGRINVSGVNIGSGGTPWRVELYVKLNASATGYNDLLMTQLTNEVGRGTNYGLHLFGNKMQFWHNSGGATGLFGNIPYDTWTHIAVESDGSQFEFFQDGVSVGTDVGTFHFNGMIIGTTDEVFTGGFIDEVKIFDLSSGGCAADITVSTDAGACEASNVSLDVPTALDNCGVTSITNDAPASFPLGQTTVIWTATDAAGNTATCEQTVTVEDAEAPTAVCQDIVVQLDANGNATITAADIDGGSSDNCGIASMAVSQTSFDCNDVSASTYSTNEALDFDGLDDNVVVPNSPSLEISGAFSLEAWIMPNSPGNFGWDIIMGKLTTGDPDYWLIARDGTRRLFFGFRDPSGIQRFVDGTTNLVNGQWYHVAGTYDGNQLKIYLNGVLEATKTIGNIPVRISSHKPFKLGWHGASWQWHGKIDEARVWDGALTASQINDNMNTCLSGSESGLKAYYNMQDGAGSNMLTDLSPNGNHGTLTDMDPNTDWTSGNSNVSCGGGGTVVTLTVTDDSGNENSCEAIVTVEDNIAPNAICQDITVQLDASGNASITAAQIDNGSSDACGIEDMTIDITDFTCTDVGNNAVTLTLTDVNGNISNCTATVSVIGLDADNDGVTTCDGDCDDNDPNNYPGNTEICDGQDNDCDGIVDEGFTDTDNDGMADCVDPDDDNDGVNDVDDNCPLTVNPDQEDLDLDGIGDACDSTVSVCDAINGQIDEVESLNLPNGLENSLISKLEGALSKFQSGNNNAAMGKLNAFINQVQAQSGNNINVADAEELIAAAEAIVDAIDNGNTDCNAGSQPLIVPENNTAINDATHIVESVINDVAPKSELTLFPNPALHEVNVVLKGAVSISKLTIYDQFGKKVWQKQLEERQNALSIDLSENYFTSGLYLIEVIHEGQRSVRRLIITR